MNRTLIALIYKGFGPSRALDFQLICLRNVIYKTVTKVIDNLINPILPHVIFLNHNSLIAGRSTTDKSIILQDVVHSMSLMLGKKSIWL